MVVLGTGGGGEGGAIAWGEGGGGGAKAPWAPLRPPMILAFSLVNITQKARRYTLIHPETYGEYHKSKIVHITPNHSQLQPLEP